jgi:hypothetical protein
MPSKITVTTHNNGRMHVRRIGPSCIWVGRNDGPPPIPAGPDNDTIAALLCLGVNGVPYLNQPAFADFTEPARGVIAAIRANKVPQLGDCAVLRGEIELLKRNAEVARGGKTSSLIKAEYRIAELEAKLKAARLKGRRARRKPR